MKKKHKGRPSSKTSNSPKQLDTPQLAEKARAALAREHWREAIADYKELLKRDNQLEWRQEFMRAYAGRANELTAKGMLKEALAIWENRAALDASTPMAAEHCALLVRLGNTSAVAALLAQTGPDGLPREEQEQLRAQLAARVLSGDQNVLEAVTADDPLHLHAEPALEALRAYCGGDDATAREALSAIPFRSPYRDWALILRALLQAEEDPQQAATQLKRLDQHSPFSRVIHAAELSLAPDAAFVREAARRPSAELTVAGNLRGWSQSCISLAQELANLGDQPEPSALMRLLKKHAKTLGQDWSHRKILALVVQIGRPGLFWLRDNRIYASGAWQQELLLAWMTEHDKESAWDIADIWRRCAELVIEQGEKSTLSHRDARIALMLRRPAEVTGLLKKLAFGEAPTKLDAHLVEQLHDSLTWDPDDRDTYLQLIDYYRRIGNPREARQTLEQALRRWPKDQSILTAALDVALDSGAFKKAANLAGQILDGDPINTDVRNRLINAHIAHAGKQVVKHRLDLARKELATAADWTRGAEARAQIGLLETLIDAEDGQDAAIKTLNTRYTGSAGGYDARVELLLAADALKLRQSALEKTLKLKSAKSQGREDLLAALTRLRHHLDAHAAPGRDLTALLERIFARGAPWKELSRGELETACETLSRGQLAQSRLGAANAALKRWPNEPLFVLHWFEATSHGRGASPPGAVFKLEEALAQAREHGDIRTAMRIEKALPYRGLFGGSPFDLFGDDEEDEFDDDDEDDPFDPMTDGEAALDYIEQTIALFGSIKALEELGAPKDMIRDMRKLQKKHGDAGVMNCIRDLLTGKIQETDLGGDPLSPPPSTPKPVKSSNQKDGKPPIQLDLFE